MKDRNKLTPITEEQFFDIFCEASMLADQAYIASEERKIQQVAARNQTLKGTRKGPRIVNSSRALTPVDNKTLTVGSPLHRAIALRLLSESLKLPRWEAVIELELMFEA